MRKFDKTCGGSASTISTSWWIAVGKGAPTAWKCIGNVVAMSAEQRRKFQRPNLRRVYLVRVREVLRVVDAQKENVRALIVGRLGDAEDQHGAEHED